MGNAGGQREERGTRRVVGLHYEAASPPPGLQGEWRAGGRNPSTATTRDRRALVRDPRLTRELYRLPVDAPIGRKLFVAVAAVLVHVLSLEAAMEEKSDA